MQKNDLELRRLKSRLPLIIAIIIILILGVSLFIVWSSKKENIEIVSTGQITKSILVGTGIDKEETKAIETTKPDNTTKVETKEDDKAAPFTTFLIILLIVLGAVIFVLQQMMQGVDAKNLTLEDRVEVAENEIADLRKKAYPYLKNHTALEKILSQINQLANEKLNLENEKVNLEKVVEEERQKWYTLLSNEKINIEKTILEERNEMNALLSNEKLKFDKVLFEKRQETSLLLEQLKIIENNNDLIDLDVYRREFTYSDSASFQEALKKTWKQQDEMLLMKTATVTSKNFVIEGSSEEGVKMIGNLRKLAIRAFNGESDTAISKVKWNNFEQMKNKILKSETGIEKMLDKWGISIADSYRELKVKELRLTFEKAELDKKIQDEQRVIKEEKREEEKAIREAETAQRKAEQEEEKINTALAKAKSEMANTHAEDITKHLSKIKELESRLLEAEQNRIRAISQAQLTRSGNVYIISNPGSFGENVYKIGMTRRLDPMDRIWELSDASVPFDFDVHGIIKSDDAPKLESKFHTMFQKNKINLVNNRKEFFRISIHEIQEVCHREGLDIKLTLAAEAKEWFESESIRKTI